MEEPECGFEFFSDFDSANLAKVEHVTLNSGKRKHTVTYIECQEDFVTTGSPPSHTTRSTLPPENPDVEFNIWTKPDCAGTEFENPNRTWFYFGMKASLPSILVKLNLIDLNRQSKMYSQGMTPVYRILPGKPTWERIRERPTYTVEDDIFTLSFKYRTPENIDSVTYFAFTYPYSYTDLQASLAVNDKAFMNIKAKSKDEVYYTRELLCKSLDGRRVDLITISSHHNISSEREARLKHLFPDCKTPRPFRFIGKKVIFISARVHPGETPASFVFNGLLNLLLTRDDPVAVQLRKLYVFKMIPFLNPDGVSRGHYRTDTRGVNLNRLYLNPSIEHHPSIYAARALIRYYHYGFEKEEEPVVVGEETLLQQDNRIASKVSNMTLEEESVGKMSSTLKSKIQSWCSSCKNTVIKIDAKGVCRKCTRRNSTSNEEVDGESANNHEGTGDIKKIESGLFLYIDMHGHATKKGIFMYGNHLDSMEDNIECMLLPKLMSVNSHHFQFTACNFTERMMYLKDKRDGLSREGSGRVAVLRLTGLVQSYTLECNYNSGRMVNAIPSTIKENNSKLIHTVALPPKFTPQIFEDVGKALGPSILDLTGNNPVTRLPNSQFHSLGGVREWLSMYYTNVLHESNGAGTSAVKGRTKTSLLQSQAAGKSSKTTLNRGRSGVRLAKRISSAASVRVAAARAGLIPVERKENVFETTTSIAPQLRTTTVLATKGLRTRSRTRPFTAGKGGGKHQNLSASKKADRSRSATISKSKSKEELQAKLELMKGQAKNSDQVKLQEICFIKTAEGKRMIAKYKASEESETVDNLIIEWDSLNGQAQLVTAKSKLDTKPAGNGEPGTSRQGLFRVHNFAKSKNKRLVRRLLTAADASAKVEKSKKRKIAKNLSV